MRSCYSQRDLPDGVYMRYDVLSPEGHLEKEVRIVCPADRDRDHLALLADGRFLWFRNALSAQNAMYAHIEDRPDDEDLDEDDLMLQVRLMERDP